MGKYRYGLIPSIPDHRNWKFEFGKSVIGRRHNPNPNPQPQPQPSPNPPPPPSPPLPASVDLRPLCPPIYDQGGLESCVSNATAGSVEFTQMSEKLADIFTPARLFIYYNQRVLEGTVSQNVGTSFSDAITVVTKQGSPHETLWPYDESQFAVQPPGSVYTDGLSHLVTAYEYVNQTETAFKEALYSNLPVMIGVVVYPSFESAPNGVVPMPAPTEAPLGGHAILLVGYDDASQTFIFRNSWGTGWGNQGYGTLPYAFVVSPAYTMGSGIVISLTK